MEAKETLLCIPDISGFTSFMSQTDFELGSKVIPSLLNRIVYSNDIGLKISEIEGDAVLFYKTGDLPDLKALVEQCRFFHSEFYKQLIALRARYNEESGAERIPEILGLKIILHFGAEVGQVPVGKRIKLIGQDVIAAHRLLKNDIDRREYILFSSKLLSQYPESEQSETLGDLILKEGQIADEDLGDVPFTYVDLPFQAT